ncbi:MAG: toll/interleukin-1 receptor domain-containing protein [Proteobacteria bacterium]|nr:toll/interleukin-1 receptor domain-containing protein [Pseudomonadota bacterium]
MNRPIEIFFSYAHEDENLMDDVRRQLIGAERRGILVKWHDRQIPPGAEWESDIDRRLLESEVILLLVSPHFIQSRYCYGVEMRIALERHDRGEAAVVPVILRPCLWHDEAIGKLQALPTDGKPLSLWTNQDEGTLNIAEGVLKVVSSLRESQRRSAA